MKFSIWLRAEWDRVAGFGLISLGAVFLLLGYLGVRDTPFVAEQMAYIASGGIGGLFCLGFGVGLLLSADLHDEWRKLDRIEAELRGDAIPDAEPSSAASERDARPVAGNGRHRPEPVPQSVGTVGALAVALTRPAGGSRPALATVSLILLLPLTVGGAGWRRASQTADLDVATRALGVAVLAVVAAFVVIALWTLRIRVAVLQRRGEVTGAIRRSPRIAGDVLDPPAPGTRENAVFVASGHHRFHRAGCAMLDWLDATPVPEERIDPGLSACGLCQTP